MPKILIPATLALAACAAGAYLIVRDEGPRGRILADVPRLSEAEALAERENRYRAIDSIEELLALPGHFARMEALYALAGRSDSAVAQNLIFQADAIGDASLRREMLLVLFARLAELDPLSALALSRTPGFAGEPRFEQEVWLRWGAGDLEAALEHASRLDAADRARAAQALFAAWDYAGTDETARIEERLGAQPDTRTRAAHIDELASTDPAAALAWAQSLESPLHRRQAAAQLGRILGRNGLEAAERWSGGLQEPALKRAFGEAAAQAAAEVDPAGTLQRLLAERSADARARLASAFSALASQDMTQALAWFEQLEDSRQRRDVGRVIAVQLAQSDPEAALAWARENDASMEQRLYNVVISTIAETNPELAVANAKTIENRWQRMSALSTVAHRVSEHDPRRAAELMSGVEDSELRDSMMQRIAMNWIQSDADAALDWIMSAPDGASRDNLMMSTAHYLSQSDVDAAIALLPRVEGDVAVLWRQQIAANLASQRPLAQAQGFIARFEGTPEYPQLVSGVIQGLAQTNPRAAVEMLRDLPEQELEHGMLAAVVFANYATQSPREAAEAAVAFGDADQRPQVLQSVLQQWARSDPPGAEQWVDRLSQGADRDAAIGIIAGHWDELTPARRRMVDSIGDMDQRTSAVMNVVFRLARGNRERAEQVLMSFNLPDERREQLRQALRQFQEQSHYMSVY